MSWIEYKVNQNQQFFNNNNKQNQISYLKFNMNNNKMIYRKNHRVKLKIKRIRLINEKTI